MDDMVEWFEMTYDADEVVDVLQIEVEELVAAFYYRAEAHYQGHKEATGDMEDD